MASTSTLGNSIEIFNNLSSKIFNLLHGKTEDDRNILSKSLDDLNSINYRYTVITNPTKAVLLVNQCCNFVSTDDKVLVQKCSLLLWNVIKMQNVTIEGRSLVVAINWCLDSLLNIKDKSVLIDVLQALDALLRINIDNVITLTDKTAQIIIKIIEESDTKWSPEVTLIALQCLEACVAVPTDKSKSTNNCLNISAKIFLLHLNKQKVNIDDVVHNKMIQISLCGVQNIIIQNPDYLKQDLGLILGLVKTYMVYGLKDINFMPPQKLSPSTLSIPEITTNIKDKRGGKVTKQRKQRVSAGNKKEKIDSDDFIFDKTPGYVPAAGSLENNSDTGTKSGFKTSDSDFSDNESNVTRKIVHTQSKIRLAAFNLFYHVIKNVDKSIMFSYWTSFIPEGSISGPHNLLISILKDPSPKCRTVALNVLLILLTSSKAYLIHAEHTDKPSAFTPFSLVLGYMVKELHKGICLALNDNSILVLVQLLKCLAALVQATPYHKMGKGLISKVVRNVKPFIYHKDVTVQVTGLIVLGCVLASEPTIPETKNIFIKEIDNNTNNYEVKGENLDDYAQFSDSDHEENHNKEDITTPWLLKRCLSNLGVKFDDDVITPPAPVKLESLQVISSLCRNYFEVLLAPYISYVVQGLTLALEDQNVDIKLFAGRAVDFIGQGICKYIDSSSDYLGSFVEFWEILLSGPLVGLLQCEEQPGLRSIGCDCLGSIGADVFELLPRDKQLLCITLLFSCTRDEEKNVKAAAVRALAICVLYPTLREDVGFVVDTSEAILRTLNDQNLMVRIKASWSLANLCDALVLNNDTDDVPEELLLKLLEVGIKIADDNDKIKMNAVRALGNLIKVMNKNLMQKTEFNIVINKAFDCLIKNSMNGSNMKVRWNACYAIGNAIKNPDLYQETFLGNWQEPVFNSLSELVVNFKNFKVRINAALALSSPKTRAQYGKYYYTVWSALIEALDNSRNIQDLTEYTHRDHLVEQLCFSLGHLASLLQKEDIRGLKDCVKPCIDDIVLYICVKDVYRRVVPEKTSSFTNASKHLKSIPYFQLERDEIDFLNCLVLAFDDLFE